MAGDPGKFWNVVAFIIASIMWVFIMVGVYIVASIYKIKEIFNGNKV